MSAAMSVIVPAHDEATIIVDNLARMIAGDPDGRLEVIVVANGCTDDTAERARSVDARIRVVELGASSKIAALTAGDRAASHPVRAFVDADVRVDSATLIALAELLSAPGGPLAAAPALVVDASRSSWLARQYFRVWEHSDYRRRGHIGSGIYGLSALGRARFAEFPEIIADDRWVELQFAAHERDTSPGTFTVPAPRTLRAQIRRATRIAAGNRELGERFPELGGRTSSSGVRRLVARVARRPSLWVALPVYAAGYLAPRFAPRGAVTGWMRDETSRT
ncbi:glycosyltransferase [Protaetiibacter larvae]|uniref:4,4'-diaponeurosporenoate glycosyltransferase n=1 Tax=Protaetiibacter larvae TaxID=2592654 RepID=A0A5C1YA09_9MICO|nr:glycosyltransferase [Protaetiibacter larvae]QEO10258.1 glycosyltransferase [Protaetiibacter larvae]